MLINSLFLPLTGLTTIKALLAAAADKENAVGFWLLDLPHWVVKSVLRTIHNFN
jgi:hypothetical protein